MPILPLSTLLRPVTRDEVIDDLKTIARWLRLKPDNWRTTSVGYWVLVCAGEVASRASVQVALLAANGFSSTAYGNGLTKLSESAFAHSRIKGVKTLGTLILKDDAGTGPHTIDVGAFMFTEDTMGQKFRNTTGGELPINGELPVTIEAETGGAASNVPNESITIMNPTIAGVTCSNPGNPTTWITRLGVDEESDDSLKTRNPNRFVALSGDASGAHVHWALHATDGAGDPVGVTRAVAFSGAPGSTAVTVYVANDDGTATAQQVADIQAYITARKSRTETVTVASAAAKPIYVTGTFHVAHGLGAVRKREIEQAVRDYIDGLPIGGDHVDDGLGRVVWSQLIEAAMGFDSVRRTTVLLNDDDEDVILQPNEIAVEGGYVFTPVEI